MIKGARSQKSLGFQKLLWKKHFAIKCYDTILYTSMH